MKKSIAIILAVSALSMSALAQTKKDPTEVKCAVMSSHTVKIADATKSNLYADYNGRRYFFCCGGCKPAFNKDPKKFAKTAISIPIPKKAK